MDCDSLKYLQKSRQSCRSRGFRPLNMARLPRIGRLSHDADSDAKEKRNGMDTSAAPALDPLPIGNGVAPHERVPDGLSAHTASSTLLMRSDPLQITSPRLPWLALEWLMRDDLVARRRTFQATKLTGNDASPCHISHIRQEPLGHRRLTRTDDGAKQTSAHFECELNRSIEILWVR
jgi:hypothetical protein